MKEIQIHKKDDGCNRCEMMTWYLRKFGKIFGKEYGNQMCSKEMEEMKQNVESIRKNMKFLLVVVVCS